MSLVLGVFTGQTLEPFIEFSPHTEWAFRLSSGISLFESPQRSFPAAKSGYFVWPPPASGVHGFTLVI